MQGCLGKEMGPAGVDCDCRALCTGTAVPLLTWPVQMCKMTVWPHLSLLLGSGLTEGQGRAVVPPLVGLLLGTGHHWLLETLLP